MDPEQVDGSKTIMVVAPHPDDAESGVGGTMPLFVAKGAKVVIVICTNGDKGTSDRSYTNASLAATRAREQADAARIIGAQLVMLGIPDQGMEDNAEIRERIVRLIRVHRPDILFTMDPSRPYIIHRDHRMTGRVTLDAIFPSARDHMSFPQHAAEGLEPHKVKLVYLWGTDNADAYFDISETIDTKYKALYAHRSQMGDPGDEGRMAQRRRRFEEMGKLIGVKYAEGFKKVELPGV